MYCIRVSSCYDLIYVLHWFVSNMDGHSIVGFRLYRSGRASSGCLVSSVGSGMGRVSSVQIIIRLPSFMCQVGMRHGVANLLGSIRVGPI